MKYMGSKRAMLGNGLGQLLQTEIPKHSRFVDLFCGGASISWYAAQRFDVQVTAVDLQNYSTVLAGAVLSRTAPTDIEKFWLQWKMKAQHLVSATNAPQVKKISRAKVQECRQWAEWFPEGSLIASYGGHYFSPEQIVWIEALRSTIPIEREWAMLALAALLEAASKAVASPGHTAQPFQPTPTAKQFLAEAWSKNICELVEKCLTTLGTKYAKKFGVTVVADANDYADTVKAGDLVFVDPPYSAAHYSRFYHVLEGIALGETGGASGAGRYPPLNFRPRSDYSMKTTAAFAVERLLSSLAARETNVIFTFPDHDCSNGLSGEMICEIARKYFKIQQTSVASVFSTLGGTSTTTPGARLSRQAASELILMLRS